ncbi:MAG TPA: hypothetical protein PLD25_27755 [Chloroflexota bacterium]|nr:hypothetical protein [Chloroflexota bacterium]
MENKKIQELQQITWVTRHYDHLQGLRQLPFGFMFLLIAIDKAGVWPWFSIWQPLTGLVAVGLGITGYWWIGRIYARTLGQVQQLPGQGKRMGLFVVVFLGLFFIAGSVEIARNWPFSASGLVIAGGLVVYYWQNGRYRPHYLILAAFMAFVSLLPLTGLLAVEQVYLFGPDAVIGALLFSLITVVGGLVDHWLLMRTLPIYSEANS